VASRDDPSGLVQFGCFVGQFICHLVDVKIADRHVLRGLIVVYCSTVVVGWWSLLFNGTRNAPVCTRSLFCAWVRGAWFTTRRLDRELKGADEALLVFEKKQYRGGCTSPFDFVSSHKI
jgi:hypothetical protein